MNDVPIILLGAGGHAKVLLDILLEQNVKILGVSVPDSDYLSENFFDIPLIGNDDDILNFAPQNVHLVNGIGSIGSTSLRQKVYKNFKGKGYTFKSVIHSKAVISSRAALREGVQVMAGAVINVGTCIGENSIVNTRAAVDHDCQIGSHVHIAPGVTISGGVKIGDGSHIGVGSTIIQGVQIGSETIIGAGSLVLRDIGDRKMAFGVPAQVRKNL